MSVFSAIPAPLRRAARAILPGRLVDGVKDYVIRRYYTPGFVSRTGPVRFAFRRYVLRKPPVLHRLLFHVTDHCNLNCKGCTHFSNIAEKCFADLGVFTADMTRVSRLFSSVTEIFLLGGEPLLHPELPAFITTTRRLMPASRINVMTNGILVPRMPEEFWTAMRDTGAWLLCDDYPVGVSREEIEDAAVSHRVRIEWTVPRDDFFKLPIDLDGRQDAAASFRSCRGVMNCSVLKDGRIYPCAYAAFIDIFEKRFGVEDIGAGEHDSISIDEDPYAVMDFLMKPIPWCRHCDFEHKEEYRWDRSKRTIDEWVADGSVPGTGRHAARR